MRAMILLTIKFMTDSIFGKHEFEVVIPDDVRGDEKIFLANQNHLASTPILFFVLIVNFSDIIKEWFN